MQASARCRGRHRAPGMSRFWQVEPVGPGILVVVQFPRDELQQRVDGGQAACRVGGLPPGRRVSPQSATVHLPSS